MPSRLKGIETCVARGFHSWIFPCSHVPSRLKGIETLWRHVEDYGYIGSHVPSRLKGIETVRGERRGDRPKWCSHVPSRLKGIEHFHPSQKEFTCAFPFEGNRGMSVSSQQSAVS